MLNCKTLEEVIEIITKKKILAIRNITEHHSVNSYWYSKVGKTKTKPSSSSWKSLPNYYIWNGSLLDLPVMLVLVKRNPLLKALYSPTLLFLQKKKNLKTSASGQRPNSTPRKIKQPSSFWISVGLMEIIHRISLVQYSIAFFCL